MDSPGFAWKVDSIFYEGGLEAASKLRPPCPLGLTRNPMNTPFHTLLLTGAADTLGRALAPALQGLSTRLRVSDLAQPLARLNLPAGSEAWPCDLADAHAVHQMAIWNTDAAWARLGLVPQDNAEAHAAQMEHLLQPAGPQHLLQGGSFLGTGPFDELALPAPVAQHNGALK